MNSRWAIFALPLLLVVSPAYAQVVRSDDDPRYQDAEAQRPQPQAAEPQTPQRPAPPKRNNKPQQDAAPEPQLTDAQKRELALKAREAAELRVEQDMVTMTSLVEALAKNLGQIHYLRTLCFGLNDQKWRDYGQRMMDVESGGDTDRHRQLVRAFNAGYYQEKDRHTQCSREVSADVAALAENGRHISSMLGDPYRER